MNFHIREYEEETVARAFETLHKKRSSTRLAFHRIHSIPARVVLCFAKKRLIDTKVSARKKDRIVVITKKGVLLTHSRKTGYFIGRYFESHSKEEKKKFITRWGRIRRIKPPQTLPKTTTNINHPPHLHRLTTARQAANGGGRAGSAFPRARTAAGSAPQPGRIAPADPPRHRHLPPLQPASKQM